MDLIYIKENSIDTKLCKEIIELYEKSDFKYPGTTCDGTNKDIKDTNDLHFTFDVNTWKHIDNILFDKLNICLKEYFQKINEKCYTICYDNVTDTGFQIQKYIKNKGKYIYHNDSLILVNENKKRIITYLWYLNNVDEGGETEFFGYYKIKPQAGKIVLFPACWTYPHCSKTPISDDKYIITGWVYINI